MLVRKHKVVCLLAFTVIVIIGGIAYSQNRLVDPPMLQLFSAAPQDKPNPMETAFQAPVQEEQTRGVEQIQLPAIPMSGGGAVPWSELLAMLSVFTAIIGAIQWIIVRVLIDPMIRIQAEQMKDWAGKTFPTNVEFHAHAKADDAFQERVERDIEQVWKRLERRD